MDRARSLVSPGWAREGRHKISSASRWRRRMSGHDSRGEGPRCELIRVAPLALAQTRRDCRECAGSKSDGRRWRPANSEPEMDGGGTASSEQRAARILSPAASGQSRRRTDKRWPESAAGSASERLISGPARGNKLARKLAPARRRFCWNISADSRAARETSVSNYLHDSESPNSLKWNSNAVAPSRANRMNNSQRGVNVRRFLAPGEPTAPAPAPPETADEPLEPAAQQQQAKPSKRCHRLDLLRSVPFPGSFATG